MTMDTNPKPRSKTIKALGLLSYLVIFILGFGLSFVEQFSEAPSHMVYLITGEKGETTSNSSADKPRIACNIVTVMKSYSSRTRAVNMTWAPRCHHHHFFYSNKGQVPTGGVALDVPEGRGKALTQKVIKMLTYSYNKHGSSVEWYMKADDDTYVIVENLQDVLAKFDPDQPYYIGSKLNYLKQIAPKGYHSGGAGYVLSREAMRRLVVNGERLCHGLNQGWEDAFIGGCMYKLGVKILNAVDTEKRIMMHSFNPLTWMNPKSPEHKLITYRNIYVPKNKNEHESLSVSTISMHYVQPHEMYMFDFLIYDLCLSGKRTDCKPANYDEIKILKDGM